MTYVHQSAAIQTVTVSDSASTLYGNQDGYSLCGARSYSITPATYAFLSLSGNQITLQSSDVSDVTSAGPLPISVSVSLVNYTSRPAVSQSFTVEVRCAVLFLSWLTLPPETTEHTLLVDEIPAIRDFAVS